MPDRSALNQVTQLGVETVPGTAVAANRLLQSIGIAPAIKTDIKEFRPDGGLFRTVTALGKEWVEAPIDGIPTYDEILYLLASVLHTATPTTPAGSTMGRQYDFSVLQTGGQTQKTYTIEKGSAVRAGRAPYGLVKGMGLAFTRDEVALSGSIIAQKYEDAVTLTAAPTAVPLVPILANSVSVYMDSSRAGIGTTKLLRAIEYDWNMNDRFGPIWPINAALPSWAAHIETEPDNSGSLLLEADAVGMGLLANARAGTVAYMRIEAIGALIDGTTTYTLRLDQCMEITDVKEFSDEDGLYAINYDWVGINDATWVSSHQVRLINTRATY